MFLFLFNEFVHEVAAKPIRDVHRWNRLLLLSIYAVIIGKFYYSFFLDASVI